MRFKKHLNDRHVRVRRSTVLTALLAVAMLGTPFFAGTAIATSSTKGGTEISTAQGAFGTMLVVGSGKFAGYTLYLITSDQQGKFGCTTAIIKSLPGGPGSCTGAPTDKHAEWPAITTDGKPIAGPGVSQSLLGSVNRKGIGAQVTYAGHPLYLFDQGPGQTTGQGWDEPSLPPWHGVWWLVAPSGLALPWQGLLTSTMINNKTVLAASMYTGIGWKAFPVYSYSSDSSSTSACTGSCAVSWPPLLTDGTPGVTSALAASSVGTITRTDGSVQITYNGKPLYLFANETIVPQGLGYVATGSGNDVKVNGGTFQLVTP